MTYDDLPAILVAAAICAVITLFRMACGNGENIDD